MFDYANVLDDSVGIHYPVHEIPSRVKLSCCTWNSYMKSNLIVSDYEGTVTLHDIAVGAEVRALLVGCRTGGPCFCVLGIALLLASTIVVCSPRGYGI